MSLSSRSWRTTELNHDKYAMNSFKLMKQYGYNFYEFKKYIIQQLFEENIIPLDPAYLAS